MAFDRSASLRYPASGGKKQALPRSSSSRARSLTDPLLQPQQLVNQVLHEFVLVKDLCFYVVCEENCGVLRTCTSSYFILIVCNFFLG